MVNLISQAEYARQRECSQAAVRKAVKTGRMTLVNGLVDPEVADIQWKRHTDPHSPPVRMPPNRTRPTASRIRPTGKKS